MPSPTSLRGTLPQKSLGARGVEQLARNPACLRLQVIAAAGLTPAAVLTGVFGQPFVRRPPPTAVVLGTRFERVLLKDDGRLLLDRYVREGLLTPRESRVVDVETRVPGTSPSDLARRVGLTERLVEQRRRGDPDAPNLILKPRLRLALYKGDEEIEPDYLVAADADLAYHAGEIKSYTDRRGKTDAEEANGARRQAAVSVVALRQLHRRLGASNPATEVPPEVDLVLRWPATLKPTLHRETVEGEVWGIERAIEALPAAVLKVASITPGALDDAAAVEAIPNHLSQGCYEHCDLVPVCKAEAVRAMDPALLGDEARERLCGVGCLRRADDLVEGRVKPRNEAEAAVQERVGEALVAYRAVMSRVVPS